MTLGCVQSGGVNGFILKNNNRYPGELRSQLPSCNDHQVKGKKTRRFLPKSEGLLERCRTEASEHSRSHAGWINNCSWVHQRSNSTVWDLSSTQTKEKEEESPRHLAKTLMWDILLAGKAWSEHRRETLLLAATRTGVENEINRARGLQHHTRPRRARQAGCALQARAKLTIAQVV